MPGAATGLARRHRLGWVADAIQDGKQPAAVELVRRGGPRGSRVETTRRQLLPGLDPFHSEKFTD
jgi:hypothetical protein